MKIKILMNHTHSFMEGIYFISFSLYRGPIMICDEQVRTPMRLANTNIRIDFCRAFTIIWQRETLWIWRGVELQRYSQMIEALLITIKLDLECCAEYFLWFILQMP